DIERKRMTWQAGFARRPEAAGAIAEGDNKSRHEIVGAGKVEITIAIVIRRGEALRIGCEDIGRLAKGAIAITKKDGPVISGTNIITTDRQIEIPIVVEIPRDNPGRVTADGIGMDGGKTSLAVAL